MKMPVLTMNLHNGYLCDIYVDRSRAIETVE
jgi:hypothetical protein